MPTGELGARQPEGPSALPRGTSATSPVGSAATGHPLATGAAVDVLRRGGNAVDAAVAAHAVLAVVLPDACGLGGDSLFLVRTPPPGVAGDDRTGDDRTGDDRAGADGAGRAPAPGRVTAYNGTGRSALDGGPLSGDGPRPAATGDGGASVLVPGSVHSWAEVLRAHGRMRLADVLAPAVALAADGFPASPELCAAVRSQRPRLLRGGAGVWPLVRARPGDAVVQPELAKVLAGIAQDGPAAFYTGPVAAAICRAVARDGGGLRPRDLRLHDTVVAAPVSTGWAGGTVHVQPPSSQGVLLAMALQWWERESPSLDGADGDLLDHLGVEVTEAVFGYRDRCAAEGAALLGNALDVDQGRASRRGGPRAYLHTTGVAVADAAGTVVSSLLSVFDDFGAGTFVPEGGFVLNNRAGGFTSAPNAPGPGRRPVHTLAPALLEGPDGVLALATPGADGQVQTLLQVLTRMRSRGESLEAAVSAPRWRSVQGALLVGRSHPSAAGLRERGHDVVLVPDGDLRLGAVVSASFMHGSTAANGDWRRQVTTGGA